MQVVSVHRFPFVTTYCTKRSGGVCVLAIPARPSLSSSVYHTKLVTKAKMPYSLKGRNVLVTGGSRGLGALVCEKFAAEGANVAINYASSKERAEELAKKVESHGVKAVCIQADVEVPEDNARLVKQTVELLGGLDVIVANAAWTRFANFGDLHDLSLEEWNKCWACNVMSHIQILQVAKPIFDKNEEGGAYIMTSSIAGITASGSSMAYSVTKAAGLHMMRCLVASQGPKIRINAVLPGLLLTEWGLRYGEERIQLLKDKAKLNDVVCQTSYSDGHG